MRRLTLAGLLGLSLAAILYGVYWYWAAQALETGIARWIADRRAEGYRISAPAPQIGGFPFRLRAEIEAPVVEAPPQAGGWRWQGPDVTGTAAPWSPLRIDLAMPGRHLLTGAVTGPAQALQVDTGVANGRVALDRSGRLEALALELADVTVTGEPEGGPAIEAAGVAATLHDLSSAAGGNRFAFDLSLAGLVLPADEPLPLGREIDRVAAEGMLVGAIPPGPPAQSLAVWRDDGGTLEAHRLEVAWGPLALSANGTFALDQAMQPLGAMTATVRGYGETIDALVAADIVRPRDGNIARMVLTAMARTPEGGGEPAITVPLTAQDGHLSVGPVRLIPLPTIRWD